MNAFLTFSVAGAFFFIGFMAGCWGISMCVKENSKTILSLNELLERKNEEIEIMKHLNREYP